MPAQNGFPTPTGGWPAAQNIATQPISGQAAHTYGGGHSQGRLTLVCQVCTIAVAPADMACFYCGTPRPPAGWGNGPVQTHDPFGPGAPRPLNPGGATASALRSMELLLTGPNSHRTLTMTKSALAIGRANPDTKADLTIDDTQISGYHAILVLTPTEAEIIDLKSTNGTMLNGQPLTPGLPAPLHNGDLIGLGSHLLTVKFK